MSEVELPSQPASAHPRIYRFAIPLLLAAVVGALWVFPSFWYNRAAQGGTFWFGERTNVAGWVFNSVPVDQSAEKVLVADRIFNGEFVRPGPGNLRVRVFSAKRYEEKANEIGLFVHTPDRCWVETGWKIEPSNPDLKMINLHGVQVPVERRIFTTPSQRELVYFCGLVGGEPLPYRLDHNLSVGVRSATSGRPKKLAALFRASDGHFWERLWDSFKSRREFLGPKQFIRISTPVTDSGKTEIAAADARLAGFLNDWLYVANYAREKEQWQSDGSRHAAAAQRDRASL
jgi:hypothetical protein